MVITGNQNCPYFQKCNHIDCDSFCIKKYKLDYLYDEAGISRVQRKHIDFFVDEVDKLAFQKLENLCNDVEGFVERGDNLYIYSTTSGNGKTSWALRVVGTYFNKIWFKSDLTCKALFINVPSFLLELKDNLRLENPHIQHIKAFINEADIVIWDDIGTKAITTFEAENLLSMIDNRINLGKSNIFTSNMPEDEAINILGSRLVSRIVNASYDIEFKGKDKRGYRYGK